MSEAARMPRTIDKIRSAQRSLRVPAEVPSWSLTLYFPPMTYAARNIVAALMGDRPEGTTAEEWKRREWVTLIVSQAELEDGAKAFEFGDVEYLINEASSVILDQLVGKMYSAGIPDMPRDVEAGKDDSGTIES